MNVDEAMADIENNIKNNPSKYSTHYKEVAETLVAEVKRLSGLLESVNAYCSEIEKRWAATQAELAEAKAASVCPVEIAALGDADWEYSVGVKCKSDDDANKLFDWLWERMKDTPPPAT